jgi:hypothetical protein
VTGIDTVLAADGCTLHVTYTGPGHDLARVLAEIGRDLAEHGPASVFWDELTPAQRRLLTARTD